MEALQTAPSLFLEWRMSAGKWPMIVDVIQRGIDYLSVQQLRKDEAESTRWPMERFFGQKPSPHIDRPNLLRECSGFESFGEEMSRRIVNKDIIHNALEQMHKKC